MKLNISNICSSLASKLVKIIVCDAHWLLVMFDPYSDLTGSWISILAWERCQVILGNMKNDQNTFNISIVHWFISFYKTIQYMIEIYAKADNQPKSNIISVLMPQIKLEMNSWREKVHCFLGIYPPKLALISMCFNCSFTKNTFLIKANSIDVATFARPSQCLITW